MSMPGSMAGKWDWVWGVWPATRSTSSWVRGGRFAYSARSLRLVMAYLPEFVSHLHEEHPQAIPPHSSADSPTLVLSTLPVNHLRHLTGTKPVPLAKLSHVGCMYKVASRG